MAEEYIQQASEGTAQASTPTNEFTLHTFTLPIRVRQDQEMTTAPAHAEESQATAAADLPAQSPSPMRDAEPARSFFDVDEDPRDELLSFRTHEARVYSAWYNSIEDLYDGGFYRGAFEAALKLLVEPRAPPIIRVRLLLLVARLGGKVEALLDARRLLGEFDEQSESVHELIVVTENMLAAMARDE